MKIEMRDDRALVFTPYHLDFVKEIKMIGGAKWNVREKCWNIPKDAVDSCRKIMLRVFGETDLPSMEKKLKLRVKMLTDLEEYCGPVQMFGKLIAYARGRDSGAKVGSAVVFEEGKPRSGGSARNWLTIVPEGSVIIIPDVPQSMYEREKDRKTGWDDPLYEIEIITESGIDKDALLEERAKLIDRIEEIDRLLEESDES